MNRYEKLKTNNKKVFIPFVTLGDPNPELSFEIIQFLIQNGADALELGLPFSDPVADGVVIQDANQRALKANTFTKDAFRIIEKIRSKYPEIPIGLLSYCNLATGFGVDQFFKELSRIGVDSILFADLPIEMGDFFNYHFSKNNISKVLLAPPNADHSTLEYIAKNSEGYIYLVGRSGVTGVNLKTTIDLSSNISELKKFGIPVYQGFGISGKKDVEKAIESGADGVIVGSAIVKIIAENFSNKDDLFTNLKGLVCEIKSATF